MSEAVSVERRKIIRSYGGKVILTPAAEGRMVLFGRRINLWKKTPENILCPTSSVMPGNYQAHYENTAIEIWQQMEGGDRLLGECLGNVGDNHGNIPFLEKM